MLNRQYSEATAEALDIKLRDLITAIFERTVALLQTHRGLLEESAAQLLERETLDEAALHTIATRIRHQP